MKRIGLGVILALSLVLVGWACWPSRAEVAPVLANQIIPPSIKEPNVQTIVAVTLKGVKAQNKITAMEANYVAVVQSDDTRLGIFHSRKTLVLPGTFRYSVDLSQLTQRDVVWDAHNRILHVTIPRVAIEGPDVDLTKAQQYADGVLTSFSSVSDALDERNRTVARDQLLVQARDAKVMRQAGNAAERALEQTFGLPMRAAGIICTVDVTMA